MKVRLNTATSISAPSGPALLRSWASERGVMLEVACDRAVRLPYRDREPAGASRMCEKSYVLGGWIEVDDWGDEAQGLCGVVIDR